MSITIQNTLGVQAVHPIPLEILEGQIDAVLSDIGADAIKIGMLHSVEVVNWTPIFGGMLLSGKKVADLIVNTQF